MLCLKRFMVYKLRAMVMSGRCLHFMGLLSNLRMSKDVILSVHRCDDSKVSDNVFRL